MRFAARLVAGAQALRGAKSRSFAFACALFTLTAMTSEASAQFPSSGGSADKATRDVWVGAEAFRNVWSLYTGITWAPAGVMSEDGVRLRVVAGQSAFRYEAPSGPARGVAPFADAMAGYQKQWGATTLKAFAGVTGYADILSPRDAAAPWGQARFGPKLVLESWTTLSPRTWLALDASWTSLEDAYWTRARLGFRLMPSLSLGLEAGQSGAHGAGAARAGGFLRVEWASGEASLAGGVAGEASGPTSAPHVAGGAFAPYATLLVLQRF